MANPSAKATAAETEKDSVDRKASPIAGEDIGGPPPDKLAAQELKAALNVGLGNVMTLQGYQGSRILNNSDRNYNCMDDELICSSAVSGDKIWSVKLEGDLNELGGHLAAPPVWSEGELFVATVIGDVLQIDPTDGEITARHKIGSPLRFSPVVADGRLYVSTQDGKVVCIKLRE